MESITKEQLETLAKLQSMETETSKINAKLDIVPAKIESFDQEISIRYPVAGSFCDSSSDHISRRAYQGSISTHRGADRQAVEKNLGFSPGND